MSLSKRIDPETGGLVSRDSEVSGMEITPSATDFQTPLALRGCMPAHWSAVIITVIV